MEPCWHELINQPAEARMPQLMLCRHENSEEIQHLAGTSHARQSTDKSTAASNTEGLCLLTATPEIIIYSPSNIKVTNI